MLPLLAALPASASILSASSQAVSTRSSNADYLRVTVIQDQLNATMRDMNDESVAAGSTSSAAPSVGEGAFVLEKEGEGDGGPRGYPEIGGLVISPGDDREAGRIAVPVTRGSGPSTHARRFDNERGGNRQNDPHAAPEPSTWMLLGTGLAMLGGYTMLRRRLAMES
jgi:hypothetical protein